MAKQTKATHGSADHVHGPECGAAIAVHPDTSPDTLLTLRALVAALSGAGGADHPLVVGPCQYHGHNATMVAIAAEHEGQRALAPMAILMGADDARAIVPGHKAERELPTGQYL